MSLEMSKGGICVGEGRKVPSRTGHDPWVLTEVGVKRGSFSILPVKLWRRVIFWKHTHTLVKNMFFLDCIAPSERNWRKTLSPVSLFAPDSEHVKRNFDR